jgi:hypothetical protein
MHSHNLKRIGKVDERKSPLCSLEEKTLDKKDHSRIKTKSALIQNDEFDPGGD